MDFVEQGVVAVEEVVQVDSQFRALEELQLALTCTGLADVVPY